jgi:hypothetical protein
VATRHSSPCCGSWASACRHVTLVYSRARLRMVLIMFNLSRQRVELAQLYSSGAREPWTSCDGSLPVTCQRSLVGGRELEATVTSMNGGR